MIEPSFAGSRIQWPFQFFVDQDLFRAGWRVITPWADEEFIPEEIFVEMGHAGFPAEILVGALKIVGARRWAEVAIELGYASAPWLREVISDE